MPATTFQFHADPGEAWELACGWASEYGLELAAEQYFPDYRVVAVSPDAGKCPEVERLERIDRAALCRRAPDLGATTMHEFVTRNEDCLYLAIGRCGDGALRESALSGHTDDPETLRIWRRLIRRARSEMHRGAEARSPHSGHGQHLPNHRHTSGAHELAARGVRMLGIAGSTEYVFDDIAQTGSGSQAHE
jgi:hypothetical protein